MKAVRGALQSRRKNKRGTSADTDMVDDDAAAAFTQLLVPSDSWLVGKELREAAQTASGALVVMMVQDGKKVMAPKGDQRIAAGDLLVLVGGPEALKAYLEAPSPS